MKIFIFGLGAIGSNLLLQLVKKYPQFEYIGIDYDVVEERNINTQAYILPHIGLKKVQVMQGILGLNLRKFNYKGVDKKIDDSFDIYEIGNNINLLSEDLILDCFDNSNSRRILNKIIGNILHIGFSPQYTAEIIWNEDYLVPNDIPKGQNDICEMSEAIPFISFVVSRACGVIFNFIEKSKKECYIITNKYDIRKL